MKLIHTACCTYDYDILFKNQLELNRLSAAAIPDWTIPNKAGLHWPPAGKLRVGKERAGHSPADIGHSYTFPKSSGHLQVSVFFIFIFSYSDINQYLDAAVKR